MANPFWSARRGKTVFQTIDALTQGMDGLPVPTGPVQRSERYDDTAERLDQLLLVSAAMWELLREKTGLTEEDLIARIAEIDARDGNADSKLTQTPQKCPQCARVISPKHQRCLYCGAAAPADTIFKTI